MLNFELQALIYDSTSCKAQSHSHNYNSDQQYRDREHESGDKYIPDHEVTRRNHPAHMAALKLSRLHYSQYRPALLALEVAKSLRGYSADQRIVYWAILHRMTKGKANDTSKKEPTEFINTRIPENSK